MSALPRRGTSRVLLTGAAGTLLLAACGQKEPPPPVTLPAHDPAAVALIRETPVIDIHAHTFNARFLPIKGIALGKRDMHPLFSLASDELVIAITTLIVWFTEKSPDALDAQPDSKLMKKLAESVERDAMRAQVARDKPSRLTAQEIASEPAVQGVIKLMSGEKEFDELTDAERKRLVQFVRMFEDEPGIGLMGNNTVDEYGHFLKVLTTGEGKLVGRFRDDHAGGTDPVKRPVDLMASHMMDMAPTYNQPEDGEDLLEFERQQIPRYQRQQREAGGKMLYFAAYNPFRDHWGEGARPGHARDIVKAAYEKHGAFGVKVYPPSGYMPFANEIPGCPFSLARQPCEQWKARYKPDGVMLTGRQLDDRLLELLRWCRDEHVPIFAHCGLGEVQARKDYDQLSHPGHWQDLLEKHPEFSELRICFGHAGGGGFWFGDRKDEKWGQTVYDLCCKYRNVYCEFGCYEAIADPVARGNFTKQLAKLVQESGNGRKPYDFSTKILYGSDWFMPMPGAADRVNYLNSFRVTILEAGAPQPAELYRRFFFKNALQFLNVEERIDKGGLPPALVTHLQRLLAEARRQSRSH